MGVLGVVEGLGPWRPLESPGTGRDAFTDLIDTMAYNIYYVLFMGFAFWVHLIGICGRL